MEGEEILFKLVYTFLRNKTEEEEYIFYHLIYNPERTIRDVAEMLGWSKSKVGRIKTTLEKEWRKHVQIT